MFLHADKGFQIYVPDSSLDPLEAKTEIVARINEQGPP